MMSEKGRWEAQQVGLLKAGVERSVADWLDIFTPAGFIDGKLEEFTKAGRVRADWAEDLKKRLKVVLLLDGKPV